VVTQKFIGIDLDSKEITARDISACGLATIKQTARRRLYYPASYNWTRTSKRGPERVAIVIGHSGKEDERWLTENPDLQHRGMAAG